VPDVGDAWTTAYQAHLEGFIAEQGWAIQAVLLPVDDRIFTLRSLTPWGCPDHASTTSS
jgi:hypothetical protein